MEVTNKDECVPLDEISRHLLTSTFGDSEDPNDPLCYIKPVDVGPIGFIDYATVGMDEPHAINQLQLSSKAHNLAGRMPSEVVQIMAEIERVREHMSKRGYSFSPSSDQLEYVYFLIRPVPPEMLFSEIAYLCDQLPKEYAEILQESQKPVQ